ncbi:unnamed protein product [Didymodactylos carnosus]|uniref:Uncharacterized protein n=1 Tax=Didymodactylos carnosus TaxID=1234261 RepID=A0A8S2FPU5_9BILA|nr:unnamed protein product [Didymodactylos carnosus]CAF4319743.1 unnamed protein product [Didymodactylos carnosus]
MAHLQFGGIELESVGLSTTVPDNDLARVMYYLSCVCSAIDYNDNDIQRYRNYNEYYRLTEEEKLLVVVLCGTLSPDVFIDKCWFESDALCGTSSNKFYNLKHFRADIIAVESIVIAGSRVQVKQIMTFKQVRNYIEPMKRLIQQYGNQRRLQQQQQQQTITYAQRPTPRATYTSTTRPAPAVDDGCCCTIL